MRKGGGRAVDCRCCATGGLVPLNTVSRFGLVEFSSRETY